nr:MAG TPA: hypothetical protein [Caudoviricetes sp.]
MANKHLHLNLKGEYFHAIRDFLISIERWGTEE